MESIQNASNQMQTKSFGIKRPKAQRNTRRKHGVMSKSELKSYYGHSFGATQPKGSAQAIELELDGKICQITLIGDKNNNLCDVVGFDDVEDRQWFMGLYRGQNIYMV